MKNFTALAICSALLPGLALAALPDLSRFSKNNSATNGKLAQMGANTIKCNNTGGTANALDCTVAQINAMGVGGGGSVTSTTGYEPETFVLNGGTSVVRGFDGVRRAENAKTIQHIIVCGNANTTSDSVTIQVNYGAALASNTPVTLATGSTGYGCTSTSPAIALSTNNLMNADVIAVVGSPENISVRLTF